MAITAMLVLGVLQVPDFLMPLLEAHFLPWYDALSPMQQRLLQATCDGLPGVGIGLFVVVGAWRRRNAPAEPDPSVGRWMPRKTM
jgi:hypothetical protein